MNLLYKVNPFLSIINCLFPDVQTKNFYFFVHIIKHHCNCVSFITFRTSSVYNINFMFIFKSCCYVLFYKFYQFRFPEKCSFLNQSISYADKRIFAKFFYRCNSFKSYLLRASLYICSVIVMSIYNIIHINLSFLLY